MLAQHQGERERFDASRHPPVPSGEGATLPRGTDTHRGGRLARADEGFRGTTEEGRVATNKQLITVLGAVPLFEGLSTKHLKRIAELATVARFMEGATIVKQGVIGDSFYVVLQGQAKVSVNGRTINRMLPGDHFGEISLLDGQERTASVIAETEMMLLEITQKDFFTMLRNDPEITVDLLEGVARAVRRMDRSLAG